MATLAGYRWYRLGVVVAATPPPITLAATNCDCGGDRSSRKGWDT
jgi:hypothetical protein